MNDKERLEEILNDLPGSIRHSGELEDLKEYSRSLAERVGELEQQNKRYREALEFYANQSNWMNIEVPTMMDGEPEMVTREPLIFDDGGRKAREALEEDTDE